MNKKQKKIINQRMNNRKMYQMGFRDGQFEQKQEIVEEMEKLKIKDYSDFEGYWKDLGYNEAIDTVLSIIKQKNEII